MGMISLVEEVSRSSSAVRTSYSETLSLHAVFGCRRQFKHDVVSNTRQHQMIFRRGQQSSFFTTKILLAAPSVIKPSRNSTVSIAPASIAIWRSNTLGKSEIALMSQRSHRLSVGSDSGDARRKQFVGRRQQWVAHDEYRRRNAFRKCMITLGNAARHMKIKRLVITLVRAMICSRRLPHSLSECGLLQTNPIQAVL